MNSKQLNFFITVQDWDEIIPFFEERKYLIAKNNVHDVNNAFEQNYFPNKKNNAFQIYIAYQDKKDAIIFKQAQGQDYQNVDILKSHAIEFTFGGVYSDGKELRRSRFYYVTKYYGTNGAVIEKDVDFIKWSDNLLKGFKKEFLKKSSISKNTLFSASAVEWYNANNAKLTGGETILISK